MPDSTPSSLGEFCWLELATDDLPGAQRFYRALLDWEIPDPESDGHMAYSHVHGGGRELGGAYALLAEQREQGVPPHWMSYVRVAKIEDAMERATAHGGTVVFGPCDVADTGRLAVLASPSGAAFSVWQDGKHCGAHYDGAPGVPCWFELMSRDVDADGPFYEHLFGWTRASRDMGPMGSYTVFLDGERQAAGMMALPAEAGPAPSHWMPYIAVEDCDAAAARVAEHGGRLYAPPQDIPGVGRFAVAADPAGAVISLIRLAEVSR